ncbi:hypothetical protein MTO96_010312 [Rhipicephalus appendiculatus]
MRRISLPPGALLPSFRGSSRFRATQVDWGFLSTAFYVTAGGQVGQESLRRAGLSFSPAAPPGRTRPGALWPRQYTGTPSSRTAVGVRRARLDFGLAPCSGPRRFALAPHGFRRRTLVSAGMNVSSIWIVVKPRVIRVSPAAHHEEIAA